MPAVIEKIAGISENLDPQMVAVVTAQSHRQRHASMGVVVAWQIADDHLLMLLQRQFDDVDHEIDASHHDFLVSLVNVKLVSMSRRKISSIIGVLPVAKIEDNSCFTRG